MPIYMKYGEIKGQEKTKGFEEQVQCSSFQFGVGRGIGSAGGGGHREASSPSVSEIVVTKMQDKSSTGFLQESLFGEGQKVKFSFTKTGAVGDAPQTYLTIELENALVSGYSLSSGGDQPSESISINFTKIVWNLLETDSKNKASKPATATWNLETGTP